MPIFNAENMLATIGVKSAEAQTVLNITKLIIPQNEISVNTQKDEVEQNQLRTKPLTDTEVQNRAMDKQKRTFVGRQKCVFCCLWATKKIFLLFLHMNSNSYITVRF